MSKRLPRELISDVMAAMGSRGGKIAAKNMTPDERKARAKKAGLAAAKKRTATRLAAQRAQKRENAKKG